MKGIISFVKKAWAFVWANRKAIGDFGEALQQIAVEVRESITGEDINGDGRVPLMQEIVHTAAQDGMRFGRKYLGIDGWERLLDLDEDDFRRVLAAARIAQRLVESGVLARFGVPMPKTRYINWAIEYSLVLADALDGDDDDG
jgi:hypothetical protein